MAGIEKGPFFFWEERAFVAICSYSNKTKNLLAFGFFFCKIDEFITC